MWRRHNNRMKMQASGLSETPPDIRHTPTQRQVGESLLKIIELVGLSDTATAEAWLYVEHVQQTGVLMTFDIEPVSSAALHRSLRFDEELVGKYFALGQPFAGSIPHDVTSGRLPLLNSSQSFLVTPLYHPETHKKIGALSIESPDRYALNGEKLQRLLKSGHLEAIAALLAPIDISRVSSQQIKDIIIQDMDSHIRTLVDIAEPDIVYDQILQVARRIVDNPDASGGLILVRDERQNRSASATQEVDYYCTVVARADPFNALQRWPVTSRPTLTRHVIESQEPVRRTVRTKSWQDPEWQDSRPGAKEVAALYVPVLRSDKTGCIGVICLESSSEFSATDQEYMERIAAVAGKVFERIEGIQRERRLVEQLHLHDDLQEMVAKTLFLDDAGRRFNPEEAQSARNQVFDMILDRALEKTGSDGALILLKRAPQDIYTPEDAVIYLIATRWQGGPWNDRAPDKWPSTIGLTGEAYTSGRTIVKRIEKQENTEEYVHFFNDMQSNISTPIKVGDSRLGVLGIESREVFHYSPDFVQWAEFLAQELAFALITIESAERRGFDGALARLEREVDAGIKEFSTISEWDRVRARRGELILHVLQTMLRLTGSEVGRMILAVNAYDADGHLDREHGQLNRLVSTDPREIEQRSARYFPIYNGITGQAFTQQQEIIYNDLEARRQFNYFDSAGRECQSGAILPVREGVRSVGVLDIESLQPNRFTPDVVVAVREASEMVSKLLVSARQRLNEILNEDILQFERKILLSLSGDKDSFMRQALEYAARIVDMPDGWGAILLLQSGEPTRKPGKRPLVDTTYKTAFQNGDYTNPEPFQVDYLDHDFPAHELLQTTLDKRQPQLILGDTRDEPVAQTGLPWDGASVQSLISAPLLKPVGAETSNTDEVIGLLVLGSARAAEFSEADKRALSLYAETVIGGMKNVAALNFSRSLLSDLRHDSSAALIMAEARINDLNTTIEEQIEDNQSASARSSLLDIQRQLHDIATTSRLALDTLTLLYDFANNDLEPEAESTIQATQIAEIVEQMRPSLDVLAAWKQREISWELSPSFAVYGGMNRQKLIHAVLFKFLDNALKYADAGSKIILRFRSDGANARVEVVSQGRLVPADERETIWSLDFRGSNVADSVGGSGQGLYQARVIAERLHAEVIYDPREPNQNIFVLRLPLAGE